MALGLNPNQFGLAQLTWHIFPNFTWHIFLCWWGRLAHACALAEPIEEWRRSVLQHFCDAPRLAQDICQGLGWPDFKLGLQP